MTNRLESVSKKNKAKHTTVFDNIVVLLFTLSFVTVDWTLSIVTFSDVILLLCVILLILKSKVIITTVQFKYFVLLFMGLIINLCGQLLINAELNVRLSIASILKVTFYSLTLFSMYNFIEKEELSLILKKHLKIVTLLIIIIGVYILFNLNYYHLNIPFEFFWTFTRNDGFRFMGERTYFRANSIFSEPAHYGFFLNTVLFYLLNGKQITKSDTITILVIIGAVITTFSYSSLLIAIVVIGSFALENYKRKSLVFNKKYAVISLIIFSTLVFVFRETIYLTTINRTLNIISGEDSSAYNRIIGSFQYISRDNLYTGNGLAQTPPIFNNFAYFITDLGIFGITLSISSVMYFFIKNWHMGVIFILFSSIKGGYLSSQYWLLLFILISIIEMSGIVKQTKGVQY